MAHTPLATPSVTRADEVAARLVAITSDVLAELRPGHGAERAVMLDSSLDRDLGLDSLARVEVLARVERAFDITLEEQVLAGADTLRDLLQAVLGAGAGRRATADADRLGPGPRLRPLAASPIGAATLTEVLTWHARAHAERPHIRLQRATGDAEVISYGELHAGARRVAAGLRRVDLDPGDAVVLMLPTSREYLCAFFGVLFAGGVPVPVYPPGRPAQLEEHLRRHAAIVGNCLAPVLVTVPEARRFSGLLRSRVDSLRLVTSAEELSEDGGADIDASARADDIALIQYTSGSTGDPKGVVLTHANLLANIRAMGTALAVTADDVCVSWLPLYHDMGLIGMWLGSLYHAAHLVVMSPLAFLARPERWLAAIDRHRGTISGGPNFAYELCVRRVSEETLEGLDLSSWRVAFNGAEPVSAITLDRFAERFRASGFRRSALMPVYGLAESSVGLTFPPEGRGPLIDRIHRRTFATTGRAEPAEEGDDGAEAVVGAGHPLPGHEVRIVDQHGRELPERRQGRLQFRGPSATSGYFRNPARTRDLFVDGWLDSGDLAYVAGGELFVAGRRKDVIIRGGRNIHPAELEHAVGELEDVQTGGVAVFGSADPRAGTERVVLLAETRERDPAARGALRERIGALATDVIGEPPDEVALVPLRAVPKTSSGKIRRAAARDLYDAGLIGKPPRSVRLQLARIALSSVVPHVRRVVHALAEGAFALHAWALLSVIGSFTWSLVAVMPGSSRRWAIAQAGARALLWLSGVPVRVPGLERLPPPGSPSVYVSNHASYLDSMVLVAAIPRTLSFVAKRELADQFVAGVFLTRIGTVFVERFDKERGLEDARRAGAAIGGGRSLVYFAEGTLSRRPGLLPFHMGAFVAAAEAGVSVVPIAIRGTRSVLRDGSHVPRRAPITVVVGSPIEPGPRTEGTWSEAVRLRDATREQILRHCGAPDLAAERPQF